MVEGLGINPPFHLKHMGRALTSFTNQGRGVRHQPPFRLRRVGWASTSSVDHKGGVGRRPPFSSIASGSIVDLLHRPR